MHGFSVIAPIEKLTSGATLGIRLTVMKRVIPVFLSFTPIPWNNQMKMALYA